MDRQLDSKLKIEFKNVSNQEYVQAVIAKHNAELVTLIPVNKNNKTKELLELALFLFGHNTPSPVNTGVTPFDETTFKSLFGTADEE